jgi:dihydrofolate reductase
VFEDPGGSEGTKFGGWNLKLMDDESSKFKFDELMKTDIQLLGRKTYEGFAKAWPAMEETTGEFGKRMNETPKYLVSTTLQEAAWKNSHIIKDNIAEEITKLKQQEGGYILVAGSGTLVNYLLEQGLVDELRLMVNPIILGEGRKLFDGAATTKLKLVNTQEFSNGTVVLTYEPSKG